MTGASRGLGEGAARGLAREGAAVTLLARDGDRAQAVAREIVAGGGRAEARRAMSPTMPPSSGR